MPNDLATTDQAHGLRELISLARSQSRWTMDDALAIAAGVDAGAASAAIARVEGDLSPVPCDRQARAAWETALGERLKRLAAKIAPTMPAAQATVWRDAMIEALSDLPALVSLTAAKRAIHRPMQWVNEVEKVVREIAAEVEAERREALARLGRLQAEMARMANPQPLLGQPDEPVEPEAVAELMARLGVRGPDVPRVRDRAAALPMMPRRLPTIADYLELGLAPDDAAAAVADRARPDTAEVSQRAA